MSHFWLPAFPLGEEGKRGLKATRWSNGRRGCLRKAGRWGKLPRGRRLNRSWASFGRGGTDERRADDERRAFRTRHGSSPAPRWQHVGWPSGEGDLPGNLSSPQGRNVAWTPQRGLTVIVIMAFLQLPPVLIINSNSTLSK